jgi:hypothetical protein
MCLCAVCQSLLESTIAEADFDVGYDSETMVARVAAQYNAVLQRPAAAPAAASSDMRAPADLTGRHMLQITVHLADIANTLRGMAESMNVNKKAVRSALEAMRDGRAIGSESESGDSDNDDDDDDAAPPSNQEAAVTARDARGAARSASLSLVPEDEYESKSDNKNVDSQAPTQQQKRRAAVPADLANVSNKKAKKKAQRRQ